MAIISIPDRRREVAQGIWKGFGKSRLSAVSYPNKDDTKEVEIDVGDDDEFFEIDFESLYNQDAYKMYTNPMKTS